MLSKLTLLTILNESDSSAVSLFHDLLSNDNM